MLYDWNWLRWWDEAARAGLIDFGIARPSLPGPHAGLHRWVRVCLAVIPFPRVQAQLLCRNKCFGMEYEQCLQAGHLLLFAAAHAAWSSIQLHVCSPASCQVMCNNSMSTRQDPECLRALQSSDAAAPEKAVKLVSNKTDNIT